MNKYDQIAKIQKLREQNVLTDEEYIIEKSRILNMESIPNQKQMMKIDTDNKEVLFSPIYIAKAGQNLTEIITVLLVSFIVIIVLAVLFITSNDIDIILVLYFLMGAVHLTALILLLNLVYRAGKNLQNACSTLVRFNNKLIPSEDLLVPLEDMEVHRLKTVPQTIQVEKQCPACGHELESKDSECSGCGLKF